MNASPKQKALAGAVAALAVGGGSAAVAATHALSPAADSQALVNDAAKQLGVAPSALDSALRKAFANRIDAAVAAGQLTKQQGVEMKARIQSGALRSSSATVPAATVPGTLAAGISMQPPPTSS